MKPNENQTTFEALPVEVLQSALSPAKMKVLNVLYRYNSLDETIEKGSFYISNEQLKDEAQIGESKKTFYDVISFFTSNKFITRQSGSRTKEEGAVASTYILHDEVILDWAIAHPKKGKGTPSMGTPKKSKCTDEVAELRAEIKRMRGEIAELRALLMGTPMGTPSMGTPMEENSERCTPDIELKSDITNHSVSSSNSSMGLPFCMREEKNTDEIANSNGEEVDTPQADKATPDDEQTTIDYLNELETTLRDSNTNLNHDEVIELAGELSAILTKQGNDYYSAISKAASECFGLLATFQCDNLTTLAELGDIMKHNLNQINGQPTLIALHLGQIKANLNERVAETAQISTIATPNKETIIPTDKREQERNKAANPVSGNTDLNPQDEETPQTSENKAAGSVSSPQMVQTTTDEGERAQNAPDKAREVFWNDITAEDDKESAKMKGAVDAKCKVKQYEAACSIYTNFIRYIDTIPTLGRLKYAKGVAEKMREKIGSSADALLSVAYLHIERRKDQLLAA